MPPLRPLSKLDELGDSVRQVIKAYHGSPYDFDAFDASKIGAGEGNQAFGHGLYFAGAEPTAMSYRDQLSRNSFMVEGAKTPMTESMMDSIGIDTHSQGIIRRAVRDGADPVDRLNQMRSGYAPLSVRHNRLSDAIEVLRSAQGPLRPNPGRMYEVEIGHPEEALLNWDARIYQQPPAIQEAVRSLLGSGAEDLRGKAAYNNIAKFYGDGLSDVGASKVLLDQGVPGIRYFDALSRGQQKGSRNYVMFPGTEDSIRILRKYGIAAPVAAGALNEDE